MLSDFFNILMIMLMLTGAVFWVSTILLCWYYGACKRPLKEIRNV